MIGHWVLGLRLMLHVIDAGTNINDWAQLRMVAQIVNAVPIDPDITPVINRIAVVFSGEDYFSVLLC